MASEGYDTAPAFTEPVIVEDPASSSTSTKHTTSHSSTKEDKSTATGHKSSTSTCTSTSTSSSPAATNTYGFTFVQPYGNKSYQLSEGHFLHASFSQICPSQNCFNDCNNLTQVFTASRERVHSNITHVDAQDVPVTLFGVCSNLGNATASVENGNDAVLKPYFQSPSADADNDIGLVISNLTMCLVDTCDNTRNPSECNDYCRPDYLLQSQAALAISPGVFQCAHQLCKSTCGLPYADQDVFGIGVSPIFLCLSAPKADCGQVLISYYIQALLLLLLAVTFVGSAVVQAWKLSRSPIVSEKVKPALKTFLNTQCYFGGKFELFMISIVARCANQVTRFPASAAIAAFFMHPSHIDPLNGYPLVSVTLMGCIGPVLTLTLLHSHGVKFRSSLALCIMSWILNTIIFFMLVSNLSRSLDDDTIVDQAIRSLSEVNLCGGSSAMVMCQEWIGTNPLQNLSGFFNKGAVPNISNVSLIWAFTAIVLLSLISPQVIKAWKGRGVFMKKAPQSLRPAPMPRHGMFKRLAEGLASPWAGCLILLLTVMLFSLTLIYEFIMVRTYSDMDVIDTNGWTFGQVVAVLFWAPPLFDAMQSLFGKPFPITLWSNANADSVSDCYGFQDLSNKRIWSRIPPALLIDTPAWTRTRPTDLLPIHLPQVLASPRVITLKMSAHLRGKMNKWNSGLFSSGEH